MFFFLKQEIDKNILTLDNWYFSCHNIYNSIEVYPVLFRHFMDVDCA